MDRPATHRSEVALVRIIFLKLSPFLSSLFGTVEFTAYMRPQQKMPSHISLSLELFRFALFRYLLIFSSMNGRHMLLRFKYLYADISTLFHSSIIVNRLATITVKRFRKLQQQSFQPCYNSLCAHKR
ncbi:hypothetical protein TRVL_04799 [Trypanosoma vivax]|nr:hypothetical protein TRVL_04799 [Trypanosoma vivax]